MYKAKKSLVYESINETKQGNKFWVQSTLTPIVKEDGILTNIVVIDTDITERKKAEDALKSKNEEIEKKNRKLWQTSLAINEQKQIIEEKSKDIVASIRYASNIQQAILPKIAEIQKHLPEVFVLYKPKDIVSGDFYWFAKQGENLIIAVVDCTGHGVPGAFMSMVGNDLLNQIIIERNVLDPAQILHSLNEGVIFSLKQSADQHSVRDGMDMGLCMINLKENKLTYSGAVRPLWLFSKNGQGIELNEFKGSIYGIGGVQYRDKPVYENHTISINKGDTFYMFSDGITDQFGGEKNKKFSKKRLNELLFKIQKSNLEKQQGKLEKALLDWQGKYEQIDDITFMGIRF